jgi:hypothetical protein
LTEKPKKELQREAPQLSLEFDLSFIETHPI